MEINEHIKWLNEMVAPALENGVPPGHVIKSSFVNDTHHTTYQIEIEKPEEALKIMRQIVVSVLDQRCVVRIEFSTHTNYDNLPQIPYQKRFLDIDMTHGMNNLSYFQREFIRFATEPIDPKSVPSKELVAKVHDFNTGYLGKAHHVGLYLDRWEYGDDWRLELCNNTGTVYTRHIDPHDVTGHTLRLMVTMYDAAFQKGRAEGATQTIEKLAVKGLRMIRDELSINSADMPFRATNILRT